MIPAHERLEAGDGSVLEPHDRLVEHLDLLALERAAEIRFERERGRSVRERIAGRKTSMRSPPRRLAWYIAISASLSISSGSVCLRVVHGDADRGGEEDLASRRT